MPTAAENFIWAQFDDDLDSILETALSGPVYRKLSHTILAKNELALMTGEENHNYVSKTQQIVLDQLTI